MHYQLYLDQKSLIIYTVDMKIGEFAKKFDLNVSTVRYYVNNGLLVPDKKNEQYNFGSDCVNDMENILKYKSYHFTLEEIQLLFFLEKTSRFKDEVVLDLCAKLMKSKRSELKKEQQELGERIASLEEDINGLPKTPDIDSQYSGVPFSFIPYLYCPKCGIPLKLDSAKIAEGYLQEGRLWCECGYEAAIENGLIMCAEHYDETPMKTWKNVDSVIALPEEFSPEYRKLLSRAHQYMYNHIPTDPEDPQMIMVGPFTHNFFLAFIDKLGKNNIYVVIDPSRKRIEKLRQYLSESSYNIVYVVGGLDEFPVKKNFADIYIDDWSTTNMMFTFNKFNGEKIGPLLKRTGRVTGVYADYRSAQKGLANFKKQQPGFKPEKMTFSGLKYSWQQGGMKVNETKSMGFTSENSPDYPQDVLGEKVELLAYTAVRDKKK